jgi:hypothetical protein
MRCTDRCVFTMAVRCGAVRLPYGNRQGGAQAKDLMMMPMTMMMPGLWAVGAPPSWRVGLTHLHAAAKGCGVMCDAKGCDLKGCDVVGSIPSLVYQYSFLYNLH